MKSILLIDYIFYWALIFLTHLCIRVCGEINIFIPIKLNSGLWNDGA